jgi:hypothetical protein
VAGGLIFGNVGAARRRQLRYDASRKLNAWEWAMLRRFFYAGAILIMITGAAVAQSNIGIPFKQDGPPPTQEQIDKQKAAEKAYNAAMHKIPDKKAPADPWADVRSGPTAAKNKHQ